MNSKHKALTNFKKVKKIVRRETAAEKREQARGEAASDYERGN